MSEFTSPQLSILTRFLQAATEHASLAMRQWTGGAVTLALDEVRESPLEAIAETLQLSDELMTMVLLALQGGDEGQLVLSFDEENGRRLVAGLLKRDVNEASEWSELERSALMETGNIFASAYLSELTRLIGQPLIPSPPMLVQDFGVSVLQQAILTQAMVSDRILICRTRFEFCGQTANWSVYFVPGEKLLGRLRDATDLVECPTA